MSSESLVLMFHGSAGGGKTMSAVTQCIIDMVCFNQVVYSMVPISFDLYDDDGSFIGHYESKMLDISRLLKQDPMFQNSIVFWDEINLWLFARSFSSVINKLFSQLITLRRKLGMSLYCTTQFLSLVDKNIRIQADAEVLCYDLHYSYPELSFGHTISQTMRDISGKFTGKMYELTGIERERLLTGEYFKGTYPTYKTFNIFEAMRKIKITGKPVELSMDNLDNAFENIDENDERYPVIRDQVQQLCEKLEGKRWYTSDIQDYLKTNGVNLSPVAIGRKMKKLGYIKKQINGGEYVYLKNEVEA